MTVRTVILPLLYLAAFAQQPSPLALIGTVEKVFGREIQVRSGQESIALYADDRTTVSRNAVYHNLSPLKAGDEISVRYAGNGSGKLIALSVWAKVTTFRGVVKQVSPGRLLVGVRSIDAHPNPTAVFGPGSRSIATGQELQVTGLDLGNGEVDAVRIAIFNTDLPLNYLRRPMR